MSRQQCCAIALTQPTLCPCLGQCWEGGSPLAPPHAPHGGGCVGSSISTLRSLPHPGVTAKPAQNLFGSRQGYFIPFDVSIILLPFGWHYPSPHSFCCMESKNIMLNFWAHSGARQSWGAWSCTGAGSWLSTVQCKHFLATNFCNM